MAPPQRADTEEDQHDPGGQLGQMRSARDVEGRDPRARHRGDQQNTGPMADAPQRPEAGRALR